MIIFLSFFAAHLQTSSFKYSKKCLTSSKTKEYSILSLGELITKKQNSNVQSKFDLSKRTASLINRLILFRQGEFPTFFLTEITKRLDSSSDFLNFTPIGPRDLYTPCLNTSRIIWLLFNLFFFGNEFFKFMH